VVGVVLALLLTVGVVRWLSRNTWALWVGGLTGAVVGALILTVAVRARQRRADELAVLLGSVATTDDMTGTEFEHWVARLMRRSGFTDVRVSGGAGDRGADLVAVTPYGGRAVVQCKRYAPHRKVTSPDVQRFAGTARAVHGADLALLVTTGGVTVPAARLADQLNITVVSRADLMEWVAHGRTPLE
jgi:restriction system protein